jgi:tetraacyldisaccharide 4'-kinase
LRFPDHHPFSVKDIKKIRNLFDTFGADKIILTTEKDAQRLRSVAETEKLPIYFLQIEVAFLNDEQAFKTEIIEHVRNNKSNSDISKGKNWIPS